MVRAAFHAVASLVLLLLLCSFPLYAQSTPARHPEPSAYVQYVPYWTTEPGWRTELQLRNNLDPGELTVTPTLRMADGTETALPPVTIKSGDVASLDLADALLKAAPQFVGSYGSLVLRYSASVSGALYAAVMVSMDGHPIAFHVDARFHSPQPTKLSREGIWWLPRDSVSDYLILSNASQQKINASLALYDSSGRAWRQSQSVGARQTQRFSVRSLLQRAGLSGLYGGIQVEAAGGAGQLDTTHLIFDEVGGFGAMMKMFGHDPATTLSSRNFGGTKEWTTRAPMLALSSPDPALGLPAGTILQPRVFVRNTSTRAYTAHIRFNWRSATAAGKTAPIDLLLKPNATQAVDVAALQSQKIIPADAQWASVVLSAPIQPDELLAVAASYDQTGRYGAQTPFSDQLAFHWEGGMWQVDSTHNSLITATNGGSKSVHAQLTLLYNQGSSQYKVEQALAPDEQMLVDLGKLIRNQVPDKDGHTMPPDLTSGVYRLRDLTDTAVGDLYEGKVIVDKTYGHAAYGCGICCGYAWALMGYDPLAVAEAASSAQVVEAGESCGGSTVIITEDFPTWATGNTAIATASKNTIHGVAAGTTTDLATSITLNLGAKGVVDGNPCPTGYFQPSGNTNVAQLSCSPSSVTRGGTTKCTATAPSGSTFSGWKFTDDNGTTVKGTGTTSTWSGTMVTSGTVSVTVTSGSASSTPTAKIAVNNRTNFAFAAVNPALLAGNSITCYNGTNVTLSSPPQSGSYEGYSCADLAFSFNFATVNDNGPNNGYEYVTSASAASGSSPTQFQYIVVSDLLSTTTFYSAQCGNFSSSNASGFIAGSQLKQNVLDHEQGSVMSHWTEYVAAQNNSNNNIGTVLESSTAPPGSTGNSFAQNAGNSARNRIAQAVAVEPCGGSVAQDSSQSCASCGNINFSPYQTCTGQPVPHCN